MENVISLGKLIGLLFCSLPTLSFVFENSKNTRNELARLCNGNHFSSSMYVCHICPLTSLQEGTHHKLLAQEKI